MKRLAPVGVLAFAALLSACGGSSAYVAPPNSFPTTQNLPAIQLTNRVINLNTVGSGYKYAKMSVNVQFQDISGQYVKANGAALTKLESDFAATNSATINAFNDVLTTDVSQKSASDLATPQGLETLRQQLIKDFNSRLAGPPPVLYVEFTDFVMQ
ncbi:MAG TPA: flagellar basal body-associated FliL family protein [Chloroflexota bacterium]|nr:flagellar basal body-associated FliL family protein [Chloroflexota bacterium]